jgi:hypothetical protein
MSIATKTTTYSTVVDGDGLHVSDEVIYLLLVPVL